MELTDVVVFELHQTKNLRDVVFFCCEWCRWHHDVLSIVFKNGQQKNGGILINHPERAMFLLNEFLAELIVINQSFKWFVLEEDFRIHFQKLTLWQ